MKAINKRKNQILAYLRAMQRIVRVDELSQLLQVSPLTIRRNLQELELEKVIIRTHGGCMIAGRTMLETEYHKNVNLNFSLKQSVGKRAAEEVMTGEVILVDDGSTTFHLGTHLGHISPLQVYTNSLALVSELNRFPGIDLSILGGVVNSDGYSVTGFLTEHQIEQIRFDKVFLGVDAIDNNGRCFVKSKKTARLSQIMLRSGSEKILLCDHTKVGHEAHFSYASLDEFDKLITTQGITEETLVKYKTMATIIHA